MADDNKILVIDDEEGIRSLIEEALIVNGFGVVTASDGKQGIEVFKNTSNIGVILTDLMMPFMNGIEVLEHAKNLDQNVEVIVLTGYGSLDSALKAIRNGAYDYLLKPIGLQELTLTVKRALERRLLYQENQKHQDKLELLVQQLEDHNTQLKNTLDELHSTQNQLVESEKLASLGQLAAGMAHEINNPISFVHSNLNTLNSHKKRISQMLTTFKSALEDNNPGEVCGRLEAEWNNLKIDHILVDVDAILKESLDGTIRVKKIVEDLGAFSRSAPVALIKCDLIPGLESTLNIVDGNLKNKAELIKEFEEIPSVRCNLHHINQVFLNLLINAMQSIENPPGKITVSTKQLGNDKVVIQVEDNGIGIQPENIGKIFDPFFTTKEVGDGVGLGLSVSYRIIKDLGGTIDVNSLPGEGTKVAVTLPVNGPDE